MNVSRAYSWANSFVDDSTWRQAGWSACDVRGALLHSTAGKPLDCWQPWREVLRKLSPVLACAPHKLISRPGPYRQLPCQARDIPKDTPSPWCQTQTAEFKTSALMKRGLHYVYHETSTATSDWCQHPTYKYIKFLYVYMYTLYTFRLRYTEPTLHLKVAFFKILLQSLERLLLRSMRRRAESKRFSHSSQMVRRKTQDHCRLLKDIYSFVKNTLNYKTMSTDISALQPRGVGKGSSNTV